MPGGICPATCQKSENWLKSSSAPREARSKGMWDAKPSATSGVVLAEADMVSLPGSVSADSFTLMPVFAVNSVSTIFCSKSTCVSARFTQTVSTSPSPAVWRYLSVVKVW